MKSAHTGEGITLELELGFGHGIWTMGGQRKGQEQEEASTFDT